MLDPCITHQINQALTPPSGGVLLLVSGKSVEKRPRRGDRTPARLGGVLDHPPNTEAAAACEAAPRQLFLMTSAQASAPSAAMRRNSRSFAARLLPPCAAPLKSLCSSPSWAHRSPSACTHAEAKV